MSFECWHFVIRCCVLAAPFVYFAVSGLMYYYIEICAGRATVPFADYCAVRSQITDVGSVWWWEMVLLVRLVF